MDVLFSLIGFTEGRERGLGILERGEILHRVDGVFEECPRMYSTTQTPEISGKFNPFQNISTF